MRETLNKLTIIGTLKGKKTTYGTTKAGDAFISVDLTVQSEEEGKVNVHRVNLWSKQSGKLAKGFETVAKEYKTIDDDGLENADKIKIDGSFDMNEYVKDGILKTGNRCKGVFVNRVAKETPDVAGVKLECVVMNNQPEIKDAKTTGRALVKLFNVGYNNTINEYNNIIVEKELAEQFGKMFTIGSTASFYIRLDNYAVVAEGQEQKTETITFGQALANVGGGTVNNYVNQNVIVGGNLVVMGKFTQEEIQEMNKLRELAKNEKLSTPATPPTTQTPPASDFGAMPF